MTMQIRATDDTKEFGKCGCGRSPTGKCIGWHGLTEELYQHRRMLWLEEEMKKDQELEEYKRQAQELWSDSCTTPRKSND
jgi:hypothetical protein